MDFSAGSGGGQAGKVSCLFLRLECGDVEEMDLQQSLNAVVLQLLQNQVRKTCFDKCFPANKFPDRMSRKVDHICLAGRPVVSGKAKCMDRMYEAHQIVVKASVEMAQNLAS